MTQQNGKIRFVMVEVEGSDATVAAAIASIGELIGRNGQRTTNHEQSLPATPSAPALAQAETSAPALPEPDQDRELSPPVGGANAKAVTTEKSVTRRRSKRRTPSAPVSAAAPAQASILKTVASGQLPVASEGKLRSNGILLECQEKPGRTFTVSEVAELARVDRHKVSVALSPSGMRSREWAPIGAFHFKRSSTTLSPPTAPAHQKPCGRCADEL